MNSRQEERDRHRQLIKEREKAGPLVFPKEFNECPNCGSLRRFCVEALKDSKDDKSIPILGSMELDVLPPGKLQPIKLQALTDVCVNCGTVYAVVLVKREIKAPPLVQPAPNGHTGLELPGRQ